jgi:two-component system, OmpR family, sensor histidine kinase MprB
MSFRVRLTLLTTLVVAVAITGTSIFVYYTDRHEQFAQVDAELNLALKQTFQVIGAAQPPNQHTRHLVPPGNKQIVLPQSLRAVQVTVTPRASGRPVSKSPVLQTARLGGVDRRFLTFAFPARTVRLSTSLEEVDHNLSHLRWLLVLISLGGIGSAALLAALVSGSAIAPLRRLTQTTELIVETGDLGKRTSRRGRDEISRLSAKLDELLATLEASLRAQRELVADASHELRTPITTLRANIELLADPSSLDASERKELFDDVNDELESMTTLVCELVELARGEEQDVESGPFRLDEVVQAAVERTARRAPEVEFRTSLEPSVVTGVAVRIERAVSNLLDNAGKWSPAGGAVEVTVRDGTVEVRDRGPGIADADLPRVFDRFYRSRLARGMPGAGLGLAIVKQIADAHGGSVQAQTASGGGALLTLRLSPTP